MFPPVSSRHLLPATAKRAARLACRTFGQSTRGWRALPTFLIVGAQRCGTTSLFKALIQLPMVVGPPLGKGVHYFDLAYGRGLDWYRGHFPLRVTACTGPHGHGVQIGESSPYYLFHPLSAERIARDLPRVRILVVLRDPVERAYSAHAHERARGYETEPFERALELETERLADTERILAGNPDARSPAHQHHAYLARGRYVEQLQRLEKHIPRERIHIVESETFFTRPEETFGEVESFLGLPHHPGVRFERHNARPRSAMEPRLRARLTEYFAPYDERLAAWLGRPPAWRRYG